MAVQRSKKFEDFQPLQPLQPSQPLHPLQPLQPSQPLQPLQPSQPLQPLQPSQSLQSLQPSQPLQPSSSLFPIDRPVFNQNLVRWNIQSRWYIPMECMENFEGLQIKKILGTGDRGSVYELCEDSSTSCPQIVKIVLLDSDDDRLNLMMLYSFGQIDAEQYNAALNRHFALTEYEKRRQEHVPREEVDFLIEDEYLNDSLGKSQLQVRTEELEHEVQVLQKASNMGITPKLHKAFTCQDVLRFPEGGRLVNLGFIIQDRWDMTLDKYYYETNNMGLPKRLILELQRKIELLHQADIAHADLHERNVVLKIQMSPNGRMIPTDIALIDFGSAVIRDTNLEQEIFEKYKKQDLFIVKDALSKWE